MTEISTLRKSKGLSQKDLADLVGITQASLSYIETGKKLPHKSTLLKIYKALDVPDPVVFWTGVDGDNAGKIINWLKSNVL